jgi:predicted helicase
VYLTNSLEESHPDTGTLFANWLSTEANEANHIKRDTPVMCVIGNPPYSGISSNNGEWISKLIEDYKYVDGVHFNERKHWLNDDYVKFLRYGQHFIEKNGSGVLAYINPHGFLDNPTFRGMRWHLLKTFDKIYTIDLHGNNNKKETSPDGSPDVNVFDIQQGVSINIFVKTGKKKVNELGKVFHFDLFGKRELKYDFLISKNLESIHFREITPMGPFYFFIPKNTNGIENYQKWIGLNDLLKISSTGVQTGNDAVLVGDNRNDLISKIVKTHGLKPENNNLAEISYRPFDNRYYYFLKSRTKNPLPFFIPLSYRSRYEVMKNFNKENYGLVISRQWRNSNINSIWGNCFCVNKQAELALFLSANAGANVFPLYEYIDSEDQLLTQNTKTRKPNLDKVIIKEVADTLGLVFTNEKQMTTNFFAPIDILDYIYAVLHSPTYREKYKEFLKIDFPRIPYPKKIDTFWHLVKLGSEIRQIHLLESPIVEKFITQYPIDGDNVVSKVKFEENYEIIDGDKITHIDPVYPMGRVYINEHQFFQQVPKVAWEFYIGGYQPAQKWLKDRKERKLDYEDILHYQKIIVALSETDRLMKEINTIEIE